MELNFSTCHFRKVQTGLSLVLSSALLLHFQVYVPGLALILQFGYQFFLRNFKMNWCHLYFLCYCEPLPFSGETVFTVLPIRLFFCGTWQIDIFTDCLIEDVYNIKNKQQPGNWNTYCRHSSALLLQDCHWFSWLLIGCTPKNRNREDCPYYFQQ